MKKKKFSKYFIIDTLIKVIILIFLGIKYILKFIWWILKKIYFGIKLLYIKLKKDKPEPEIELKPIKKKKQIKIKKFKVVDTINGNILSFENLLKNNKSFIGIILGARGQGKSALGMRLIENIHYWTNRRCMAIGFEQKSLPKWIQVAEEINDIPNGSVVLIDEGGILFSSRESMSSPNKLLSSLLLIARHKDISILFISQNSSNLELNAIRQADFLLLKPSSLLQKDFERKKIKDIYTEIQEKFDEYKNQVGITYIYSDVYNGFVTNELPSFWSEEVSKAFKKKV